MRNVGKPCRAASADAGVTIVELLVTVILISVAGGLGLTALSNYGKTQDQQQTANTLLSDLRRAGQLALSEGRTYCMRVDDATDSWTLYRKECAGPTSQRADGTTRARGQVTIGALSMSAPASAGCPTGTCVYFKPRGTATQTSIAVQRVGAPAITVTVEGLTGRVDRS